MMVTSCQKTSREYFIQKICPTIIWSLRSTLLHGSSLLPHTPVVNIALDGSVMFDASQLWVLSNWGLLTLQLLKICMILDLHNIKIHTENNVVFSFIKCMSVQERILDLCKEELKQPISYIFLYTLLSVIKGIKHYHDQDTMHFFLIINDDSNRTWFSINSFYRL